MRGILIVFAMVMSVTGAARANEQDIFSNQAAYEAARQNGDFRAASAYAEAAYLSAKDYYGEDGAEVTDYGTAYAGSLNDIGEYEAALDILQVLLDAEAEPQISFQLLFEVGRTLGGLNNWEQSHEYLESALQAAEEEFGSDSIQAARANMELGKPHLNYADWRFQGDTLDRVIGTGYGYSSGNDSSLDRAEEIYSAAGGHEIELQRLNVYRAGNLMAANSKAEAGRVLEPALDRLSGQGYMDDEVLTIYVDWVGMHLRQWSVHRMEQALVRAFDMGSLRQEGDPIPLARSFGVIDRRVCIDHEGGYIEMEFSVNEAGQLPRIRTYETSHPDRWDQEVWRTMRGWAYIPGQLGGEVVRMDGLHFRWNFSGDSRDC